MTTASVDGRKFFLKIYECLQDHFEPSTVCYLIVSFLTPFFRSKEVKTFTLQAIDDLSPMLEFIIPTSIGFFYLVKRSDDIWLENLIKKESTNLSIPSYKLQANFLSDCDERKLTGLVPNDFYSDISSSPRKENMIYCVTFVRYSKKEVFLHLLFWNLKEKQWIEYVHTLQMEQFDCALSDLGFYSYASVNTILVFSSETVFPYCLLSIDKPQQKPIFFYREYLSKPFLMDHDCPHWTYNPGIVLNNKLWLRLNRAGILFQSQDPAIWQSIPSLRFSNLPAFCKKFHRFFCVSAPSWCTCAEFQLQSRNYKWTQTVRKKSAGKKRKRSGVFIGGNNMIRNIYWVSKDCPDQVQCFEFQNPNLRTWKIFSQIAGDGTFCLVEVPSGSYSLFDPKLSSFNCVVFPAQFK